MSRIDPPLVVRLPVELKDRLKQEAKGQRRTLTGQVIHILEAALPPGNPEEKRA